MNNENLEKQIAAYLSSRGRWLRAGHNDLPRYLSITMQCGPGRVREIVRVLMAPSDVLDVEHQDGLIRKVGLRAWRDDQTVIIEDVLSDVDDLWLALMTRDAELIEANRRQVDIDEALQLAAESEAAAIEANERYQALVSVHAALQAECAETHSDPSGELEGLRAKLAGLDSANGVLRETIGSQGGRLRDMDRELTALRPLAAIASDPTIKQIALEMMHDPALVTLINGFRDVKRSVPSGRPIVMAIHALQ